MWFLCIILQKLSFVAWTTATFATTMGHAAMGLVSVRPRTPDTTALATMAVSAGVMPTFVGHADMPTPVDSEIVKWWLEFCFSSCLQVHLPLQQVRGVCELILIILYTPYYCQLQSAFSLILINQIYLAPCFMSILYIVFHSCMHGYICGVLYWLWLAYETLEKETQILWDDCCPSAHVCVQ